MCVIIEANTAPRVFAQQPDPDFAPLLRWLLRGDGKLVTGGTNQAELFNVGRARAAIVELSRAGRTAIFPDSQIENEQTQIERRLTLRSDDPHIIALGRVSRTRTLCTEDRDLMADFTDRRLIANPRGKIYRNASHRALLRHTPGCPGSRG